MPVRDFFKGYGEIDLGEAFVSARFVLQALESSFRIRILEESPSHVKCKIIRFGRLYAFPVLFPNPALDIAWRSGPERPVVTYRITCYDYYVTASSAFIFGIASSTSEHTFMASLKMGFFGLSMVLIVFGGLVLIDTKCLVHRIRKALVKNRCIAGPCSESAPSAPGLRLCHV